MDAEEVAQLEKLIRATKRRLNILEEQAALNGRTCPPEILIEIEDLRRKLEDDQGRLDTTERKTLPPQDTVAALQSLTERRGARCA